MKNTIVGVVLVSLGGALVWADANTGGTPPPIPLHQLQQNVTRDQRAMGTDKQALQTTDAQWKQAEQTVIADRTLIQQDMAAEKSACATQGAACSAAKQKARADEAKLTSDRNAVRSAYLARQKVLTDIKARQKGVQNDLSREQQLRANPPVNPAH